SVHAHGDPPRELTFGQAVQRRPLGLQQSPQRFAVPPEGLFQQLVWGRAFRFLECALRLRACVAPREDGATHPRWNWAGGCRGKFRQPLEALRLAGLGPDLLIRRQRLLIIAPGRRLIPQNQREVAERVEAVGYPEHRPDAAEQRQG